MIHNKMEIGILNVHPAMKKNSSYSYTLVGN